MISSWGQSLGIHLGILLFFSIMIWFSHHHTPVKKETFQIPIEQSLPEQTPALKEIEKKSPIVIKSVNTTQEKVLKENKKKIRQVYGASRNSITDKSSKEGISFKKGNTLTKEVDQKVLKEDDVDSLPTPTEEYLVSQMPQVLNEVRPEYPQQAKAENKEGDVVLSVLIDAKGAVRQVKVLEGESVFHLAAITAMKQFKFKPATMEGKSVAVRIRYTLRFVLEN